MQHGKSLKTAVESKFPAVRLQYGYHGCHKASIQVFDASGKTILDWSVRCQNWGNGRLEVNPSVLCSTIAERIA